MNAFPEGSRRCSKLPRFTVWAVICALLLPAPVMTAGAVRAASSDAEPWNRHVHERLNSPERAAAVVKMHEEFAKSEEGERHARGEGGEMIPPPSPLALSPSTPHTGVSEGAALAGADAHSSVSPSFPAQAGNPGSSALADSGEKALDPRLRGGDGKRSDVAGRKGFTDASRPQSLTEVLFNYGAGFMGVPGLAPRRGVDGSLDEGLGFHQDGTARKAGGVAGASGPSDRGQRAREYMRSGLQGGAGASGPYASGPYASGLAEPGHDPATGMHWRGDPTRGGRAAASGSNGGGYSRELGDFDPLNMAIDRGLNWGAGFVNSMGEAAISGLVDGGRARLNFRLDKDGYFSGEGDALLPFYDGTHTTIYTQLGARSMHDSSDTRWIGNFGLGQRWFPLATGEDIQSADYDAGNLMLGYNAFFDYDLTRDHQRGGIGAEAQWDWFRLASNYYFPLSGWKGSEDFDSAFVEERAAEGWDARIKAYLPFYRNVALTGAYSQWFGDHVGMFGHDNLEKDPKVWSYGVEYTPIPLVSGFVTQKSTERGRTDTEFGLNFTWHFGMPWEEQTSHSKVAELRSVGGSRHEFVDRENKIILEYRAKNSYRIEYLGRVGTNAFKFRIVDGFGKYRAGQNVTVSASGVTLAAAPAAEKSFFARAGEAIVDFFSVSTAHAAAFSRVYVTNANGEFILRLGDVNAVPVVVTIQAGSNSQSFTLTDVELAGAYSLEADPATLVENVASNVTFTFKQGGTAVPDGTPVTFIANGNFTNLPGTAATNASGQVVAAGLTANALGAQTIQATINGKTASVGFTVISATAYTLEASPTELTEGTPTAVTFTLKQGGAAVGSDVSVTFAGNAVLGLLAGPQSTDNNGQITLNLTPTALGSQKIEATVDGQSVSVNINVVAYTLEASMADLTQHKLWFVDFTFKRNGAPVPDTPVTFKANTAFTELANDTSRNTDANGKVGLYLTATAAGNQTIQATVGGQTVSVSFTVAEATYVFSRKSSSGFTVGFVYPNVEFLLQRNNEALPNTSVTLTGDGFSGFAGSYTTGPSGVITVASLTPNATGQQTITATVEGRSESLTVEVFSKPDWFLELAEDAMDWGTAMTYCTNKGGSLPLRQSYSSEGGFPDGDYWTRVGRDEADAYVLLGYHRGLSDAVHVVSRPKSDRLPVVCVR